MATPSPRAAGAEDIGFDRVTGEFTGLGGGGGGGSDAAGLAGVPLEQLEGIARIVAEQEASRVAGQGSFRAAQDVGTAPTRNDFQGLLTPELQGLDRVAADDVPDIFRDTLLGLLSEEDRIALQVANFGADRGLGLRFGQPAIKGGQAGFEDDFSFGGITGTLAEMALPPGIGSLVKKAAGFLPRAPLGFNTIEETLALNAARRPALPGEIEGGQQLSFNDPIAAAAAGGGFGAGLPQLPGGTFTAGGAATPADAEALTVPGLAGTTRALQELQRQRLVRTLIERLDEQSTDQREA